MQQKETLTEPRTNFLLLLLIVITGAILRFIYFDHCPYTHDEISSLVRTGYSSLSELLEKGVKPDTHPPLLQIFLQYYTKIFGANEMVVKFPFVICGILSIIIAWEIATKWFNNTTALLTATVISTMQYTVMYSVIARQYALGLFLTLLLVFSLIKFFETESKKKYGWLAAFTITGVACSYLHYFCLLFTAITSLTGFLFASRKNILAYFIACTLILLFFIPYIPFFFIQLGYGGVGGPEGWLGKPDSGFFLQYIRYIFHYSDLFILLTSILFLFSLMRSIIKREKIFSKYRLIYLTWFLLPLLIGYFYSVKVNPILQYSVLIFSFPYFLIFLFSFLSDLKPVPKISLVILLLSISTVSMVAGRKHYELFYNQGINKIISEISFIKQQYGKNSVDVVINVEDYFLDYYKNKFPVDEYSKYLALSHADELSGFKNIVSKSKNNYFVFATVRSYPVECIDILKEYFPYCVSQYHGHLTEIFSYSRIPGEIKLEEATNCSSANNFSGKTNGWNYDANKIFSDSVSGEKYFHFESSDEFGLGFSILLEELVKSKSDIITVSVNANMQDTASSPLLVMTMENAGKTLDWRAAKFSGYLNPNETGPVFLSVRFSDIHVTAKNTKLKVYVWNNNHSSFRIKNITVCSKKGNPYFYGLFENFSE